MEIDSEEYQLYCELLTDIYCYVEDDEDANTITNKLVKLVEILTDDKDIKLDQKVEKLL